jgi:tape measure domain-containing protein
MSVVANIAINVDSTKAVSQLQAVDRATNGLSGNTGRLQQAFGGLGGAIQGIGGKMQALGQQFVSLGSAAAGLGAGLAIKGFADAGIAADRTGKTINALAGSYNETKRVTDFANSAAEEFGIGQTTAAKAVADLYGRLRPMGVSLTDIERTFSGVNKAAGLMNLTAADTDGVMLQLSQAMGSGALQGDELRSIMERLPAVGQAVAKVMGVTVGEIKELGADGMITTDIIIKAMDELNKLQPPPPDPFKLFTAAMEDASTAIGKELLPLLGPLSEKIRELINTMEAQGVGKTLAEALKPIADLVLKLVDGFLKLDPKAQKMIIQFGALAVAFSLVAVPIGIVVGALGSIVSAFGSVATVLAGLKIGATIAGWAATAGPAIIAIKAAFAGFMAFLTGTLLPGLVAFFSGPVGWTVLAVAAVVAMVVLFRKPIGEFLIWLGGEFNKAMAALGQVAYDLFVKPWVDLWNNVLRAPIADALAWISNEFAYAMNNLGTVAYDLFVKPWVDLWENVLRGPVTAMIGWLENAWKDIGNYFRNNVVEPIRKYWDGLLSFLRKEAKDISDKINKAWKSIATFFENNITKPIQTAWNNLTTAISKTAATVSTNVTKAWDGIASFFTKNITSPISTAWNNLVTFLPKAMSSAGAAVRAVFTNIATTIKSILNGVLASAINGINRIINEINWLVGTANAISAKVGGPQLPILNKFSIPQFAEGGVVNKPTLAMVGEGGEREYIIPESKMAATAANYLNGVRGGSAIPSGNAQINVTTGPVMQQGGQQYVTVADLEKAMRKTADGVYASLRTPASRIAMGRA